MRELVIGLLITCIRRLAEFEQGVEIIQNFKQMLFAMLPECRAHDYTEFFILFFYFSAVSPLQMLQERTFGRLLEFSSRENLKEQVDKYNN